MWNIREMEGDGYEGELPGYCFSRQRKQSAASDVGLFSSAFASPIISKCKGMPVCVLCVVEKKKIELEKEKVES